jgi:hypothetical protein
MPYADNSTAEARSSGTLKILLLSVTVLWCGYWFVHAWPYWEDDAFIHLEFARSLAAGQGFAFNGHVVAGDTAPLWVILLAGMHTLIPDWIVAGKTLTVLGAAVGFAGTYAFARRLAGSLRLPDASLFPAAMVLLVAFNPFTCYWIFSGMEPLAATGLACFAVLATTVEAPSTRTFLTGCLFAGIAPLVRPEMTFLTALLALPLLAQWVRLPKSTVKLANLAVGAVLLCAPLALWSLYSLHAFGHLLPNTNAAKRAAPGESVLRHLLSIYSFGFPLIVCGLCAGILSFVLRTSSVRRSLQSAIATALRPAPPQDSPSLPLSAWIFILWVLINTAFYIANHTYVQTRYILVTAPALTVVIMAVAFATSRRAGRAAYVLALLYAAIVSVTVARPFIRNKGIDCQTARDLALFIRDHVPPTAAVAAFGIGELAFVSQHPIVDTGGITRPEAIPYLYAPFEDMVRWAQSQGAQYFVIGKPGPDAVVVFSEPLRDIGWTFHTSEYENSYPLQLWSLAPGTGAIQPAGAPQPARPLPE